MHSLKVLCICMGLTLLCTGCIGKAVDLVGKTASTAISVTTSTVAMILP